jgi:hypothetical protein
VVEGFPGREGLSLFRKRQRTAAYPR